MKKIFSLLLLLLPFITEAQKHDLSVSGGVMTNIPLQEIFRKYYQPGFGPDISVKYQKYRNRHLLSGVQLDVYRLQYATQIHYTDINARPLGTERVRTIFSDPGISLKYFGGNHFQMKHATINAGISVGIMYNHIFTDPRKGSRTEQYYAYTNYGIRGGFFFEYIYYFKHLGIGFNFSSEFITLINSKGNFVDNSLILPTALGLHYRF